MSVYDTSVCVINAHLAAFKENLEERNSQFHKIVEKMKFQGDVQKGVYEYDLLLWLGDLNYRIEGVENEEINTLVRENRFAELFAYDQLRQVRADKRAFGELEEGPVDFPPTYKFVVGGNEYNIGQGYFPPSDKRRDPSWCDRILWRGNIEPRSYSAFLYLSQSDHKPVSLNFSFRVSTRQAKEVDEDRLLKVKAEVYSVIDQQHHNSMPRLKVSSTGVRFRNVRYKVTQSSFLTLENIGQSPLSFDFKSKSEVSTIPSWLKVIPPKGFLAPKETSSLEIIVYVNEKHARKVYSNPGYFAKILVLSVTRGSDYFVRSR